MCGRALSVMLLTLAVVLPTPHDYSGTFQGGYSARFTASRRVLKGARRVLYPSKQPRENTAAKDYHAHVMPPTCWAAVLVQVGECCVHCGMQCTRAGGGPEEVLKQCRTTRQWITPSPTHSAVSCVSGFRIPTATSPRPVVSGLRPVVSGRVHLYTPSATSLRPVVLGGVRIPTAT